MMKWIYAAIIMTFLLASGCAQTPMPAADYELQPTPQPTLQPTPVPAVPFTGNQENGIRTNARTYGMDFWFYHGGNWKEDTLRGVNIGVTLPGQVTKTGDIPYNAYMAWFKQISEMNANCIRVYSKQNPAFYSALADYNREAACPLWLYQGVWIEQEDALDKKTVARALECARDLVEVVHGSGKAKGYISDVSEWLGGWIIGSEWSASYIAATNKKATASYEGTYLFTEEGAPAFESNLCAIGDGLLAYETKEYKVQAPVAFINWSTTDVLEHPSEADPFEDAESFDMELILSADANQAGLFALYHVYPTYPEFISQEAEKDGFAEYLGKLVEEHTMPVVIGEYGASSSRGMSHRSQDGLYSQGGLNEQEQSRECAALTHAIFRSGMKGAMLFSWQDEWFKDVWNVSKNTIPLRNNYWYNAQNSEQSYGLLGVFPHEDRPPVYIDGEIAEWSEEHMLYRFEEGELYVQYDEGYLYLMFKAIDIAAWSRPMYFPISFDEKTGLTSIGGGTEFDRKTQFVIEVRDDTVRLLVSATHDSFASQYGGSLTDGTFHPIYQYLRGAYTRPDTGEEIPMDVVETGLLRSGITNPYAQNYDSLADYYRDDDFLEIRLPWMLIGYMDPSEGRVMYPAAQKDAKGGKKVEGLYIGFGLEGAAIPLVGYEIKPWGNTVTFHERLKQSYYEMQEVFGQYDLN